VICRRSNSVTLIDRHLSAARMSAEHQLQDGSLAERIGNNLETTAFLDKEAFE
jgi:hypothetical protein